MMVIEGNSPEMGPWGFKMVQISWSEPMFFPIQLDSHNIELMYWFVRNSAFNEWSMATSWKFSHRLGFQPLQFLGLAVRQWSSWRHYKAI